MEFDFMTPAKQIIFTFLVLLGFSVSGICQLNQALFIPDTLSGPVFNLQMNETQKSFFPGQTTATKAVNSSNFLGPTLIMRRGWAIQATVNNNLSDTTTLHWHGLHVPAHADGGPHLPILPGQQWNPHFTCLDKAGTYWYHPHVHGKTGTQTLQGLAGLIIVRDAEESTLTLPRSYGADDFPLILQSLQFDSQAQIVPKGFQDSIVLVNGTLNPFLNVPAQWVRLRLLNASNARNFNVGLANNLEFKLIGGDGGLLGKPLSITRIRLAPGERAEILVNFQNHQGDSILLKSYGSEISAGVQGGPIGPLPPGTPPMKSPLNGQDFTLLEFRVINPLPNSIASIPDSLAAQTRLEESLANGSRTVVFSSVIPGSIAGPFLLNDSTFNMDRIDFEIPINSTEIWNIHNQTTIAHPFHIHGFSFYILDRYGALVEPEEAGRKDVVLVNPNEQLRIITRFSDFSDPTMAYMFHCHLLSHEDEGMMGQFTVVPLTQIEKYTVSTPTLVSPNPFTDDLSIQISPMDSWTISDALGRIVLAGIGPENISTTSWKSGFYILNIKGKKSQKIIRQI